MFENRLVARMFENRGWTEDYIRAVNDDARGEMLNCDRLVDELHQVKLKGKPMTLLSDFDMDGIMSAVIGFAGFAELGFRVNLYMPDQTDGYGFKAKQISDLKTQFPNTEVILTSDVGITCVEGVKCAHALGMDILITDHHAPGDVLPPADLIVDPMQAGDTYAHPKICGAHVIHQILSAYAAKYAGREIQEQIRRLRVFAGIGTVSDSMPLLYENRQLVRDAVSICKMVYSDGSDFLVKNLYGREPYQRAFRGLFNILKAFAAAGTIKSPEDINSDFFGFYLAPTFNSVKRVGRSGDMNRVYNIFFGEDGTQDIQYLLRLNAERKTTVAQYYQELLNSQQPYAPHLYISSAPAGILGLLAQKMMDMNQTPCCVVCHDGDKIHGSGRSYSWYPFKTRVLEAGYGAAGHDEAFGIGFRSEAEFEPFCKFVADDFNAVRTGLEASKFRYRPDFIIAHDGSGDTVIDIVLFMEFLEEIRRLEPFGDSFQKPDILLKFRPGDGEWIRMGNMKQHLKIRLPRGFDVILFNQAHFMDIKDDLDVCYVRGSLGVNVFRNTITVQFLGDFMPANILDGGHAART